jgi:hypothetical protein
MVNSSVFNSTISEIFNNKTDITLKFYSAASTGGQGQYTKVLVSLDLWRWQHCQFQSPVLFPHSQFYMAYFMSCSFEDVLLILESIEGVKKKIDR